MSAFCSECGAIRKLGTGNSLLCSRCYTAKRRGGPKLKPDPERGQRVRNFQVAITEETYEAIVRLLPNAIERAEWARRQLKEGVLAIEIMTSLRGRR